MKINVSDIQCVDNRKNSDGQSIRELAENIGAVGLLNPITLKRLDNSTKFLYTVIAGRRRFRALQLLEKTELTDGEFRIISADPDMVAFCENFHREQLSIQDELAQLQSLSDKYGTDKAAFLAKELGKSEVWVRTRLRLLNLSPKWRELLDNNTIPISYLEEVGKYSLETQENLEIYHVTHCTSAKQVASAIKDHLVIKLPKKHWPECDSCPKNPATDSFFFSESPASCTDRVCLREKVAAELAPILESFKNSNTPVYVCRSHLYDWQTEKFFEKKFNFDFCCSFEKKGSDNLIIVEPAKITVTKGSVSQWEKGRVLFAPKSKTSNANVSTDDPKEQLKTALAKLKGKRMAQAICNLMKALDDVKSAVKNCIPRFEEKEQQIRLLILKYGYSGVPGYKNPALEEFLSDADDGVWHEKILAKVIANIHERLRCLHRDHPQSMLPEDSQCISRWADDIGINFHEEFLKPAKAVIPETKKITELRQKIKESKKENEHEH